VLSIDLAAEYADAALAEYRRRFRDER